MRIVELPFDVDPVLAKATLKSGTLQVVLPSAHGKRVLQTVSGAASPKLFDKLTDA